MFLKKKIFFYYCHGIENNGINRSEHCLMCDVVKMGLKTEINVNLLMAHKNQKKIK